MTTFSEFKISIMQGWCSCLDPRLSCYQLVKLCSKELIEQYHHHRRRRRHHHHHRFNVHFSIIGICSIFTVFESDGIWVLLLSASAATTFNMTVHVISPSCCVRGALGAHIHFLRMVDRRNVSSEGFFSLESAEAVVDKTIIIGNMKILQVEGNSIVTIAKHIPHFESGHRFSAIVLWNKKKTSQTQSDGYLTRIIAIR